MPADETALAIHHHDLAVVAEIHLEAVEHAAAGAEAVHLHAALAQPLDKAVRQRVAADGVIEEEHLDAVGRAFQQQLLEALAEASSRTMKNCTRITWRAAEIALNIASKLASPLTSRRTRLFARVGVRVIRTSALSLVAADLAGRQGLLDPGTPVQLGGRQVHLAVGLTPRLDVGVETAATEHQVRQQGQVRHEYQRGGPGDRALCGAHGEHGMDGGDEAEYLDADQQQAEVGGGGHCARSILVHSGGGHHSPLRGRSGQPGKQPGGEAGLAGSVGSTSFGRARPALRCSHRNHRRPRSPP